MNFETLVAVYHYCNHYHSGQASREYRVLCRVSRVLTLNGTHASAAMLADPEFHDARSLYVRLAAKSIDNSEGRYDRRGIIGCILLR